MSGYGNNMVKERWRKLKASREFALAAYESVSAMWIEIMHWPTSGSTRACCLHHNTGYPALLDLLKIYRVIRDDDTAKEGDIRLVDEGCEGYLYPAGGFVVVKLPRAARDAILNAADMEFDRQRWLVGQYQAVGLAPWRSDVIATRRGLRTPNSSWTYG